MKKLAVAALLMTSVSVAFPQRAEAQRDNNRMRRQLVRVDHSLEDLIEITEAGAGEKNFDSFVRGIEPQFRRAFPRRLIAALQNLWWIDRSADRLIELDDGASRNDVTILLRRLRRNVRNLTRLSFSPESQALTARLQALSRDALRGYIAGTWDLADIKKLVRLLVQLKHEWIANLPEFLGESAGFWYENFTDVMDRLRYLGNSSWADTPSLSDDEKVEELRKLQKTIRRLLRVTS